MKMILGALALALAVPAAAQTAPAPEKDCCEKMKAEGKECCCKKEHHDKSGEAKTGGDHAGHDGHAH